MSKTATKRALLNVLFCLAIVLSFIFTVGLTVVYVDKDFKRYQNESLCVNNQIRKGYERHDVATGNGTCWIKSRINSNE